ncbi:MAG: FAD-dependent oxidoreductase [Candidatus Nanopelagicales bacterium]
MTHHPRRVVVVGAGLAGVETCRALRDQGYAGGITLFGDEDVPPYDRPPLSKEVLLGALDDTTLPFDFAAHEVEVRLGERIDSLDAPDADAVVLAVGSQPIALPGARTLRTAGDALALRALMTPAARVIVVGAGWIGAEVATAAGKHGCQVEVFEALSAPLAAGLPEEIGRLTVPWFEEAGIALHLGVRVGAVERLDADLVVAGVGVRPDTRWLEGVLELDESGGVVVDERLRTSRPGVWAVGDCAAWWSPRYQRRLRVEHWDIALRAPSVVAASVLGIADAPAHDPVPYVWSDQFGRRLAYAGRHEEAVSMVFRGDPSSDPAWSVLWLSGDDALAAVFTVGRPHDLGQGRRLIERGSVLDVGRIPDPDVQLRDCVAR